MDILSSDLRDGVDVGEMLLKEGLAVPYGGGKKIKEWCSKGTNEMTP